MKAHILIKKIREQLKMTQVEFGAALGLYQRTISAWELGRNYPSTGNALKVKKLAAKHHIEVTLEELMTN